jgi:hypothetical protein
MGDDHRHRGNPDEIRGHLWAWWNSPCPEWLNA